MSVFDPFHHDHINTPVNTPLITPVWTSYGWGVSHENWGYNPTWGVWINHCANQQVKTAEIRDKSDKDTITMHIVRKESTSVRILSQKSLLKLEKTTTHSTRLADHF